jgi:hypothetical protein
LTPRIAGTVFAHLIFLQSTAYHRTKRGAAQSVATDFNQPLPGMFGRKGDALGLAGLDRERVEPERFPAVVKPVEQAEVVAVQTKDACDSRRGWSSASTTMRPALARNAGCGEAQGFAASNPLRPAQRDIDAQRSSSDRAASAARSTATAEEAAVAPHARPDHATR